MPSRSASSSLSPTVPPTERGVIYRRVSDPKQAAEDKISLEDQEQQCRAKASELGITVTQVYTDTVSGDVLERPGLQQLIHDMRQRKFEVILTWKVDRWSRDNDIRAYMRILAATYSVRLVYVQMKAESDTLEGRLVEQALGMAAEIELRAIRERTQMGRRARAAKGLLLASSQPKYGYQWVFDAHGKRSGYALDPETAPIVQRIITEVAAGRAIRRIIDDLNADGVPTRAAVARAREQLSPKQAAKAQYVWVRQAIAAIVQDPAYHGEQVLYRRQNTYERTLDPATGIISRTRRQRLRASDAPECHVMAVPAIVTAEQQAAAQARLATNQQQALRSSSTDGTDTLLRAGYVFCGYCGAAMTVRRRKGHPEQTRYLCMRSNNFSYTQPRRCPRPANAVYVSVLDRQVWADLHTALKETDLLYKLLARYQEAPDAEANDPAAALQASIAALEASVAASDDRLAALIDQAAVPGLAQAVREALAARMAHETDERTGFVARLHAQQGELAAIVGERAVRAEAADAVRRSLAQIPPMTLAQMRHHNEATARTAPQRTYRERRDLLRALGVRVTVWAASDTEQLAVHGGRRYDIATDFGGILAAAAYGSGASGTSDNAYNVAYSCTLPPPENTLRVPIEAGELTYPTEH